MKALIDDVQPWSRLRWGAAIAGVTALQLALVLTFGNGRPAPSRHLPVIRLMLPEGGTHELQALTDPTLFALGGPQGFSAIWMEPTNLPSLNPNWDQPPRWLPFNSSNLGLGFVEFARSNLAPLHGLTFKAPPRALASLEATPPNPLRTQSALVIAGDLTDRRLLNPPALPSQSGNDLLNPSEVRVVVDSRGLVTSAILLPPGSGSKDADRVAVEQAWQLRFSPTVSQGATPLAFGNLIFNWLTVPPAAAPKESNE